MKNCRHCILRFKKSKLLLNLFVGELSSISDNINNTIFQDLVLVQKLFDEPDSPLPSPGLTISVQKTIRKSNDYSGELRIHLPFLCFTKDIGYFKDHMTLHATNATISQHEGDLLSTKTHRDRPETVTMTNEEIPRPKPGQIEVLFKLETEQNFFGHIDEGYWRYFRGQEKKHFEGKDDQNSSPEPSSTRGHDGKANYKSELLSKLAQYNKEKVYLVLLKKTNKHKELLEEFEAEPLRQDCKLDKLLVSVGEITFSFEKPEDFTAVLNVMTNSSLFNLLMQCIYS